MIASIAETLLWIAVSNSVVSPGLVVLAIPATVPGGTGQHAATAPALNLAGPTATATD